MKKKNKFSFCISLAYSYLCGQQVTKQMDNKDYIAQFTENLFWDTDPSTLDVKKYPAYVIQRVLENGEMQDWRLINKIYGLPKIVEVCKELRTLDPVCLSFICAISHTRKEDYRCYRFIQHVLKLVKKHVFVLVVQKSIEK